MDMKRRKPGRPRGPHVGEAVRARLTPELHRAAQAAKKILGVSMSDLIRAGVQQQVIQATKRCIDLVRSPGGSFNKKLRALDFIYQARFIDAANELPPDVMAAIRKALGRDIA